MHSSPLIRFLLALIGMVLLGLPLWNMLYQKQHAPASGTSATATAPRKTAPAVLTVRFSDVPTSLVLHDKGKEIASLPAGESSPWETEVDLPQGSRRAEWTVEAVWPDGRSNEAVTLELEPPSASTQSATRWSSGASLHDSYSFSW